MVGCVIPNAPPTRNEDKPSSLAVKTTPRAKKKEKSDMNEKLAQALQKGKEIAVPLCIKGKELALTGYAKGNELKEFLRLLPIQLMRLLHAAMSAASRSKAQLHQMTA